jgi:hypothetical protein
MADFVRRLFAGEEAVGLLQNYADEIVLAPRRSDGRSQ